MEFLKYTKKNHWEVEKQEGTFVLPPAILQRYPLLPQSWMSFAGQFSTCTNGEGTVWFLCQDDYEIEDEMMFSWDFIEKICLKTAGESGEKEVASFWNNYFPILFDIGEKCRFLAIKCDTGEIIQGSEPDFMEISVVAKDFDSFLSGVISGSIPL